ncbi:MAG: branched-chain amino acid ABC transporter permease [Spirochaetaceae bacterium]|jgi:branched-chain amino acid transport system permease protein|nr:branched-chain amino acid ABC transporter permease [Spirochaetaceae bacterium]
MRSLEILAAQIVNGISLGSIYVLLVTGFNLLLLVARIIHFSFPVLIVFSIYMAWIAMTVTGNVFLAFLAALVSAVLINVVSAPLFQQVTRKREPVDINTTMIISMSIGMVITEWCSHAINKGLPISFLDDTADPRGILRIARTPFIRAGLISVNYGQVFTLAAAILLVGVLFWILYKTKSGRAFRAIAENPGGARLVGIPIFKTGIQSYVLTGVLGGLTAVLMALLLGWASADLGDQLGHKVLGISIIAGLGSLGGGLVIGLLLGIGEALVQGFFSGIWSNTVVFFIMLVVVLVKPRGIFGSQF